MGNDGHDGNMLTFSAMAYTVDCGCVAISCGITEASTTRRLDVPYTFIVVGSTTPMARSDRVEKKCRAGERSSPPISRETIAAVPIGW